MALDGSANRAADVGRRGLLADKPVPLPEGAAISDSLEYLGRVESPGLVEGKFDRVGGRRNLITTGRFGFRTYDVSDADEPRLLDAFQPPEILGENGYWQDEDMDIDTRRKLIIGALDPRHDDVRQDLCPGIGNDLPGDPPVSKTRPEGCRSGFYVISYANPRNLRQIGDLVGLPAGHTATCIDRCNFVWTGGPARRDDLAFLGPFTAAGRGDGRPIWVTDLRDPAEPKVFGNPIDLWRNDQATDYSHDVRSTRRASRGSAAAAAFAAMRRRAATAIRSRTWSATPTRGTRSSSPAAA